MPRRHSRTWKDHTGRTWAIVLNAEDRYKPGALLVFAGRPQEGQGSPKILVRGLVDVYSVPDPSLPFYFEAAQAGGFVWCDRDGIPWHIQNRTRIRSAMGRGLEIHHARSHRTLWELPDVELEELVRQSVG